MKKNIAAVVVLCSIFVFSGLGCKGPGVSYTVPIDIWGTFDNTNAYSESFSAYTSIDKSVAIVNYHKHTLESYKQDLLDALAAGNGPDIFMIHNSWMPDFVDKTVPVPEYMITEQDFRNNFVDVVADDMIVNGQIYGVPLSVDSLALYYNKDIFNAAGITHPPKTWEEFNAIVKALTDIDEFGNLTQSAASIGTAYNVNRSTDILTAMMIQNGTEMSSKEMNTITFADPVGATVPSEQALKYYTDFASAASPVYTWNKRQNYSIDEFYEGSTAMMINYSWHYDTIKEKNAKLNFTVSDLPQVALEPVGSQANFANYWVFVVAKNKQVKQSNDPKAVKITDEIRIQTSWQLLRALTFPSSGGIPITNFASGETLKYNTEFDLTERYLEKTGKPAARRDLIAKQQTDVRLGSFANGNLIARSWWRNNATAIDAIFADMIDSVNIGASSVHDAIELGSKRSQQLMK